MNPNEVGHHGNNGRRKRLKITEHRRREKQMRIKTENESNNAKIELLVAIPFQ